MLWAVHTGSPISACVWGNLRCESTCEPTVLSAGSPNGCTRKGAQGCVSVSGTDEKRVYERVSISAGPLISHPSHQQRCHVAEQIPALMDESNLLPTQRALLLALQKVLRNIPLRSRFYSSFFQTNTVYLCFAALTGTVFFLQTEQSSAQPWWKYKESLLVMQKQSLNSSWTLFPNWRSWLEWWWLCLSFFLFIVSEWCFSSVQRCLCAIKGFPQVLQLPGTLNDSNQPRPEAHVLTVYVVCDWLSWISASCPVKRSSSPSGT